MLTIPQPLSFTASLLSVISAANAAVTVIEKLCQYFNAPYLVLQLLNEVSDFQVVLASVQETTRQLGYQSLDTQMVDYLHKLIDKSLVVLLDIKRLTEGGLIQKSNVKSARLKISWKSWLKQHDDINKFSESLRNIRSDFSAACTLLTASSVPRVRIQLHDITMACQELGHAMEAQRIATNKLITDVASLQPSTGLFQVLLQELRQRPSEPAQSLPTEPIIRFQTSIHETCSPLCMCRCHHRYKIKSPSWMKGLIGRIFIGYSGVPFFGAEVCSEKACKRQASALLQVNYYFPTWFLSRMLVLRDQYSPLHGHMINISTPRIVQYNSHIFHLTQKGAVEAVRKLFAEGLASPFDVDEKGMSALRKAVYYRKPEMCRFLLSQHADPNLEDVYHQSPNDILLAQILSKPLDATTTELKMVMGFDGKSENMLSRRFSIIHRIVLGLTNIDLKSQLLVSTADIESRCSEGRTPIFWAAIRNDLAAVKILLSFGADVKVYDCLSESILHNAVSNECLEVILSVASGGAIPNSQKVSKFYRDEELRISETNHSNSNADLQFNEFLNHPSNTYKFTALTQTAIIDALSQARILLAYGALTEVPNAIPPVTMAVQSNARSVLELLLQSGARQDVVDEEAQGVLHLAGSCADLETMKILKSYLCCLDTNTVDIFGYTPLQVFDTLRSTYTTEEKTTTDQCRSAFLELLSGINIHSPNHYCWANKFTTPEPEEKDYDCSETSSTGSMEENFFDAESVVGDLSNELYSMTLWSDAKGKNCDFK